jgi:L-iditol 2-dehydrogenase
MTVSAETMIGVTKLEAGRGHVDLSVRSRKYPGPGEVLLEVAGTGICGTDLHIWAGEYHSVPPVTIGHEICGVVSGLGEGVEPGWLGQRVAVETYYSTCGRCRYCRGGRRNLCLERKSLGTHVDGGMAPWVVVPDINLHEVPDWVGDAPATLSEPLACICNSMMDPAVVEAGDAVLVIGPGAMGLLAAQVARACGGTVTVRGTEADEVRLGIATELGFEVEVAGAGGARTPAGPNVDVVIECSGSEPGARYGFDVLRRGGAFVLVGLRGADITIRLDLVCFHEFAIRSGFASTAESWNTAMRLIWQKNVELAPLISEVLPLKEWEHAFNASRAGRGVKYVLDPRR